MNNHRHPSLCPVCLRAEEGVGFGGHRRTKILWTCVEHVGFARRIFEMPNAEYEAHRLEARKYADEAMGNYLMKINKFDLRDLSPVEADKLIDIIVQAHADAMEKHLGAPF